MSIHKTAGAKWYYSTTIANSDTINALSDAAAIAYFTALTYIEVGETENLGTIGDNAQSIPFISTGNSRVRKVKGAKDAGTHQVTCGRDPLDLGQIALITAAGQQYNHPFKIVAADVPPGTTTPSVQYYAGLVMGSPTQWNDNNSVTRRIFNVEINTAVYEQAAT